MELFALVPALEAKPFSPWTEGAPLTPIRWEESAAASGAGVRRGLALPRAYEPNRMIRARGAAR